MADKTIVKALFDLKVRGEKELDGLADSADDASKSLGKAGKSAKKTNISLANMAKAGAAASAAAMAALSAGMLAMGKSAVGVGAQMEGFNTRLTVLMGSSDLAKDRLDELFRIGTTTPFELPGLVEAEVNLRALGVNAEETLPLVMDFAGAMGVDLASAAVEVGRAMQFGAGAVETISGRALRAQVELRTGTNALKMDVKEFRAAMVDTLTDPQGIFAGGTQKLAATFDGMVSNMADSWFKFQKQIADAGLFDAAKIVLGGVLEEIGKNQEATQKWAEIISEALTNALLGSFKVMGFMADTAVSIAQAFLTLAEGITKIGKGIKDLPAGLKALTPGLAAVSAALPGPNEIEEWATDIRLISDEVGTLGGSFSDASDFVDEMRDRISKAGAAQQKMGKGGPPGKPPPGADKPTTPPVVTTDEEEAEEGPSIADNIAAAMEGITAFQSMAASLKDMPTQLALSVTKGVTGPLTDPLGAMLGMLGPAGAVVGALGALGDDMKGTIKAGIKSFFDALESLPEVIEFVIGDVVPRLISKLPTMLISIAFKIIPALIRGLFVELPQAFADGFVAGFRRMWKAIKTFFREMFNIGKIFKKGPTAKRGETIRSGDLQGPGRAMAWAATQLFGKKHGGARHIDRSGLALLQQGEAVIPSSGTTTQRQARGIGAMMGGGGQTINITTHVVDPDAVGRLGQMLQNHYGAFGRSTQPIFGGT